MIVKMSGHTPLVNGNLPMVGMFVSNPFLCLLLVRMGGQTFSNYTESSNHGRMYCKYLYIVATIRCSRDRCL